MEHWMCSECGYLLEAETPPDRCPSCQNKCRFDNVSCYIPECGGPGNPDVRLIQSKLSERRLEGQGS
jgi:rubredoxin